LPPTLTLFPYTTLFRSHTYQHAGQAAINVTVTDVGGSSDSSSSTAHISSPLAAQFTYSPSNPCQQKPITFDTSGSQGGTAYDWLDRKSTRLNSSHRTIS